MNREDLVPGLHAVREALIHQEMKIRRILIKKGKHGGRVDEIIGMAEARSIPIQWKEAYELEQFLPDVAHQGVIAVIASFSYIALDDLLDRCHQSRQPRLVLAADHITDEGNLGALVRTAAFFGIQGLVLPRDRSAGVTGKILKRSSGAFLHLPVARVVNLGRALDRFKKAGFWVIGAAEGGKTSIYGFDWDRDVILVLGSENKGISRFVKSQCDESVCIPSWGHVPSLNVSVAGGIILSEIVRQRNEKTSRPTNHKTA